MGIGGAPWYAEKLGSDYKQVQKDMIPFNNNEFDIVDIERIEKSTEDMLATIKTLKQTYETKK